MIDPKPPSDSVAARVLLVDDHDEIRSAMVKYLMYSGFEVVEAVNGQAAIDALRNEPRFRFLLTDLQLPDIDGMEVARFARETTPTIWTALITGWPTESDDARKSGIDHVFIKPVVLGDLCKLLKDKLSLIR